MTLGKTVLGIRPLGSLKKAQLVKGLRNMENEKIKSLTRSQWALHQKALPPPTMMWWRVSSWVHDPLGACVTYQHIKSKRENILISNKNILKRRRVSPEYTGSIHQGQKQIKCIKYKSPWNHGMKKKNKSLTLQPNPKESWGRRV